MKGEDVDMYDVIIIGGGVSGAAAARELSRYKIRACVVEKEEDVCCGTSKANSAIVHAGYDAVPSSLMAKLNVKGNEMMESLARKLDFPFKRTGSLVVCLSEEEMPGLQKLYEKGLSGSSVKYAHRILGVAFEHARKYHYIETNPVRDTITKFGKQGKTPDPYTIEQMRALLANVNGTQWELAIILAGLYGLRLSECIGLRWRNVDFSKRTFAVVEQLPYGLPAGTKMVSEMAPVKSSERVLPITQATMAYFERQFAQRAEQKKLFAASGEPYFDNELVISKANGIPARRERISANFGQLLRQLGMPHIRFHDLRHTAATNMHQLTGDFYTVGQILGHSLKGVGIQLGMGSNLESVTAQYVDVRLDRKRIVLEAYHDGVLKGK